MALTSYVHFRPPVSRDPESMMSGGALGGLVCGVLGVLLGKSNVLC